MASTALCRRSTRKWLITGAPLPSASWRGSLVNLRALAHRYSLSLPGVATVVLGVKNRTELHECVAASERGALDPELIARVDAAAGRTSWRAI